MDAKAVKLAKRQASKIMAYQSFFASPEGQLVLADMMEHHYINRSTVFDGDFAKMALREGERNVILRILSLLKTDVKTVQERIKSYEQSI